MIDNTLVWKDSALLERRVTYLEKELAELKSKLAFFAILFARDPSPASPNNTPVPGPYVFPGMPTIVPTGPTPYWGRI